MVLGYGGFLGLSTREYKEKLRNAHASDLKKQERVKIRAQIAYTTLHHVSESAVKDTLRGSLPNQRTREDVI